MPLGLYLNSILIVLVIDSVASLQGHNLYYRTQCSYVKYSQWL